MKCRVAIINQKVEEKGIKITPEATSFLANNIEANIREIEGKLQQLSVHSLANRVDEIDLNFVQTFLNPDQRSNNYELSSKLNPTSYYFHLCQTF